MAYKSQHTSSEREERGNFLISNKYPNHYFTKPNQQGLKRWEFRLFPAFDASGEMLPQVFPVDGNAVEGIGDAFHAYESGMYLGSKMYCFISETTDFADRNSPTFTFVNKMLKYFDEEGKRRVNPEWLKWRDTGKLSKPQQCMFLQGLLLHNHEGPVVDKMGNPRGPCVIYFSKSATIDMETKMTTPLGHSAPISANNSLMGDILSPDRGGKVVVTTVPSPTFGNRPGKNTELYVINRGADFPLNVEYCRQAFVPWDSLVQKHDAKWQIARLVETFDPQSVDYALGGDATFGKMLPEGVKGAFHGHAQEGAPVSMPSTMQHFAAPQQQQQQQQQPVYAPQPVYAQQPAYAPQQQQQQPVYAQQLAYAPQQQQPVYVPQQQQTPVFAPQHAAAQPYGGYSGQTAQAVDKQVSVDPATGDVKVLEPTQNPAANDLLKSILEERDRQIKASQG